MGFFDKLKLSKLREGLQKSHDDFVRKINRVFYQSREIDDQLMLEIEEALLSADVGVKTTDRIIAHLIEKMTFMKWSKAEQLRDELRSQIGLALMNNGTLTLPDAPFELPFGKKPYVIMIVGVNGVGKTTTIGKLAHNFKKAGKKVVIGAADTFRAAANSQLEVWATRAEVEIVQQHPGADPSAVAFDTVTAAKNRDADVVLIDTAGRLHNKVNLMAELQKLSRVMQKVVPDAPHEIYLVLDATTGQNAVNQAREFTKVAPITGLILTKLDGTAKGGIVIALTNELNVPVRYIGVGEKIDDLQPFDPLEFSKALLGDEMFREEVSKAA